MTASTAQALAEMRAYRSCERGAHIRQRRGGTSIASASPRHDILQPGPARETAPCPYYAKCGGCQYQHLTYAEECRLKENQVREAFARVGKMPEAPILPIIAGSKVEQLRENIAALDITLSSEQMSRLDAAGNPGVKQGWIQPT